MNDVELEYTQMLLSFADYLIAELESVSFNLGVYNMGLLPDIIHEDIA